MGLGSLVHCASTAQTRAAMRTSVTAQWKAMTAIPTSPTPRLRTRTTADLPALADALCRQHDVTGYPIRWPLPVPTRDFIYRRRDLNAWVVTVDERPVGHVAVGEWDMVDDSEGTRMRALCAAALHVAAPDVVEVTTLFVDPDHFGKGIGATLMRTATSWIRAHGRGPALEVASSNQAPIRLYERLGWQEVGQFSPWWAPSDDVFAIFMVHPVLTAT